MSSNEYPSDWNSRRKKVYRRDGYECQNCGAMGGRKGNAELHAHHIVPKSKGGTHDTTNLVTVCKDCHDAVHGNKQAPTGVNTSSSFVNTIESAQDVVKFQDRYSNVYEKATGLASIHKDDLPEPQMVRDSDTISDWYKNVRKQTTKLKQVRWELDYDEVAKNVNGEKDHVETILEEYWGIKQESLGYMSKISALSQQYMELLENIECGNCGNIESSDAQFCGSCGSELYNPLECDECGEKIVSVSQEFCKSCGSELIGFPEEKVEDINRIRKDLETLNEELNDADKKAAEIIREIAA